MAGFHALHFQTVPHRRPLAPDAPQSYRNYAVSMPRLALSAGCRRSLPARGQGRDAGQEDRLTSMARATEVNDFVSGLGLVTALHGMAVQVIGPE
ncbi:MAG: hypothetical protein F4213_02110 [Boseongicola sp. SB0677_bin_26]|nr:hypothetical protein [Boseongicola sp. SB0677_bin_26]